VTGREAEEPRPVGLLGNFRSLSRPFTGSLRCSPPRP
jgi:hypothetical protein